MRLLPATSGDLPFLRAMLVEAGFPAGTPRPPDPWADDHLVRYLDGWGRSGDLGLVAWSEGAPVGASWTRLLPAGRPGYGFVDEATPELTVAVVAAARGEGVGRALVAGALDLAALHGHAAVSLSVADSVNPGAASLYRRTGFWPVGRDAGGSLTMVAPSRPRPPDGPSPIGAARLADALDAPAVARLRQVMFTAMDVGHDDRSWVRPLLAMWPEEEGAGRWVGVVIDDPHGRPIASALAEVHPSPPGPGRPQGRVAHVGSVATEAPWRRMGAARAAVTALVEELDRRGVESSTLTASAAGADLYTSLGFVASDGRAMRRPHP